MAEQAPGALILSPPQAPPHCPEQTAPAWTWALWWLGPDLWRTACVCSWLQSQASSLAEVTAAPLLGCPDAVLKFSEAALAPVRPAAHDRQQGLPAGYALTDPAGPGPAGSQGLGW